MLPNYRNDELMRKAVRLVIVALAVLVLAAGWFCLGGKKDDAKFYTEQRGD